MGDSEQASRPIAKSEWKVKVAAVTSEDPRALRPRKLTKREQWTRKIDFLVACVGFSVGLGNVWRFPFLCYKNGGGAFLIPYSLAVMVGGIPLFLLEVALGQFMSEGGIGTWKIVPLMQGIGFATAVVVFLLNCEYNVIISWAFYYIFASFNSVLPWSHCDNDWNSPNCTVFDGNGHRGNVSTSANMTGQTTNVTLGRSRLVMDPVTEFWERKVLGLSPGIGEPGVVKWDLALCLLLAWVIVYFCIWKGIRSSGKVMYFTASSPYLFMFVLLVRGVTLEGAAEGLRYYLVPDWVRLSDPQVWVDAGMQIFFSYSISLGTLTALGSYNAFHHKTFRHCLWFAAINTFTSFLAGFVIFSVLGFMAHQQNIRVSDVAESGPGLAFLAYPEALSQLPVGPLWSVMFFAMIILLGIDSQFVGVEGFVTAVVDLFPRLRQGRRKELFVAGVCVVSYLIGLSMVTEGGMYVFQLFDYYSSSRVVLAVGFFECITVAYVYGVNRFYDNLEMMFGFRLGPWMKICWLFCTPVYTLTIFILGCVLYSELTYKRKMVTYEYPPWAIGVGWTLCSISVMFIPLVMAYRILTTPGTFLERVQHLVKPRLRKHQLRSREDLARIVLEHCPDENDVISKAEVTPRERVGIGGRGSSGSADGLQLRSNEDVRTPDTLIVEDDLRQTQNEALDKQRSKPRDLLLANYSV